MAIKERPEKEILVAAKIEETMHRRLKERAKAEQRSIATIIKRALGKYLDTVLPE